MPTEPQCEQTKLLCKTFVLSSPTATGGALTPGGERSLQHADGAPQRTPALAPSSAPIPGLTGRLALPHADASGPAHWLPKPGSVWRRGPACSGFTCWWGGCRHFTRQPDSPPSQIPVFLVVIHSDLCPEVPCEPHIGLQSSRRERDREGLGRGAEAPRLQVCRGVRGKATQGGRWPSFTGKASGLRPSRSGRFRSNLRAGRAPVPAQRPAGRGWSPQLSLFWGFVPSADEKPSARTREAAASLRPPIRATLTAASRMRLDRGLGSPVGT